MVDSKGKGTQQALSPNAESADLGGLSAEAGPVIHEVRYRPSWLQWLIPAGVFSGVESYGVLTSQHPLESLGLAVFGGLFFHFVPNFLERGYCWRVTSSSLVYGRLRWPFLRGVHRVPLSSITAIDVVAASRYRKLKESVAVLPGDHGRIHPWNTSVVLVHVNPSEGNPHRVVIGFRKGEEAESMAGVLRGVSGAS